MSHFLGMKKNCCKYISFVLRYAIHNIPHIWEINYFLPAPISFLSFYRSFLRFAAYNSG